MAGTVRVVGDGCARSPCAASIAPKIIVAVMIIAITHISVPVEVEDAHLFAVSGDVTALLV